VVTITNLGQFSFECPRVASVSLKDGSTLSQLVGPALCSAILHVTVLWHSTSRVRIMTSHHIITSHHHIITSHHHIITSSHHHIITSSHHHIITSSHHHIITSSHHHIIRIMALWHCEVVALGCHRVVMVFCHCIEFVLPSIQGIALVQRPLGIHTQRVRIVSSPGSNHGVDRRPLSSWC